MSELEPFYEESQSIYDLSNEFFALFLGRRPWGTPAGITSTTTRPWTSRRTRSSTWRSASWNLRAGHDVARHRLRLGWALGARDREVRRQRHRHHAEPQPVRVQQGDWLASRRSAPSRSGCRAGRSSTRRSTGSCTIGAFEAFKKERYSGHFSTRPTTSCPTTAACCCTPFWRTPRSSSVDNGIALTISDLKFMRFIGQEIFPGGQLPAKEDIVELRRGPRDSR